MYRDYSRRFSDEDKARKFAEKICNDERYEKVTIEGWVGAFGYHEYEVCWNKRED